MPPPLLPLLRDQRKVDLGHLKILSVFHFVGGALSLLGLLFLLAHYAVMSTVLSHPEMWHGKDQAPPPEAFFVMFHLFKWFYAAMGLWFVGSAVLNVLSGIALHQRKWRLFSLIVGGLNCLHMPLGTVLGVFTIVVLIRESVQEVYEVSRGATPTGSPPG